MSGQLIMLPTTAPKVRRETLALELIDGFEDAVPSAKLRELIHNLGLLQPVVVVPARSGALPRGRGSQAVQGHRRARRR